MPLPILAPQTAAPVSHTPVLASLELMYMFSKTNHHYSERLVNHGFRKKRSCLFHLCDLILTFLKAKLPAKSAGSKWGMSFRSTVMQDAIPAALDCYRKLTPKLSNTYFCYDCVMGYRLESMNDKIQHK